MYRDGKQIIETFAILSANNPESVLTRYKFNYFKVKGEHGNKEESFLIYNLTLEDAKSLATYFQQRCFIFGKNTDDGLVFQSWANKSGSGYVFAKADEKTVLDNATDKKEFFTRISGDYKFSIPFERFDFDNDEMMKSLYSKWFSSEKYRKYFDENLTNSLDSNKYTFLGRVMFRERLYSGDFLNETVNN